MAAADAAEAAALPAAAHIGISAGATVDLLGLYLRRHALLAGVRLQVSQGDFDDPMGDLDRFAKDGVEHLLLAPFLDTLEPSFEARAAMLSEADLEAREADLRARWRLVLTKAAPFRSVFLCGLHRIGPPLAGGDRLDAVIDRLNRALREEAAAHANVRWIDMAGLVAGSAAARCSTCASICGIPRPIPWRCLDEWARQITAVSRGYGTRFHKGAGARLRQHALGRRSGRRLGERHQAQSTRLSG